MASADLMFGGGQASGFDELAGASPVSMNVIVDQSGAVRRRPGIMALDGFYSGIFSSSGIVGIHGTYDGDLYAVANTPGYRTIYKILELSAGAVSTNSATGLVGPGRPVFAETEALLAIAGGEGVQKILFSTGVSSLLGGSPPLATHVISNSQRLLLNDSVDLSRIKFSETSSGSAYAGHEVWLGGDAGYFNAEARADGIVGLHELAGEIYVFGSSTLQIWGQDAASAYAPLATSEQGLSAPYGVVRADQSFAYPDDHRRFVISNGRSQETISDAIQGTLDGVANWETMFGYRVKVGPVDCMCWTVPGDRTFAYQVGGGWSTWAGWDGTNWTPFTVGASSYLPLVQKNVVGTIDGRVGCFDMAAQDDFGTPIHAYAETGFMDNGTAKKKKNTGLYLTLRRTNGYVSESSRALLSWRDDLGAWNPPVEIDLSRSSDFQMVIHLRSLGVYRTRQWRFSFAGAAPYLLAKASEEFQVLEN